MLQGWSLVMPCFERSHNRLKGLGWASIIKVNSSSNSFFPESFGKLCIEKHRVCFLDD